MNVQLLSFTHHLIKGTNSHVPLILGGSKAVKVNILLWDGFHFLFVHSRSLPLLDTPLMDMFPEIKVPNWKKGVTNSD
jgi:hypothetical protein